MGLNVYVIWLPILENIKTIAIPGFMLNEEHLPYYENLRNIPFETFDQNYPADMRAYKYVYSLPIQIPRKSYTWHKAYVFEIKDEIVVDLKGYTDSRYNEYHAKVFHIEIPPIKIYKAEPTDKEPEVMVFTKRERRLTNIEGESVLHKETDYWSLSSFDNPDKGFVIALLRGKDAVVKLIYKYGTYNTRVFFNGEEIEYRFLD